MSEQPSTRVQVQQLAAEGMPQREIAEQVGVSQQRVSQILTPRRGARLIAELREQAERDE